MEQLVLLVEVIVALAGLWATLCLALLGMYNYQFYRLVNRPSEVQRQRLGGLMRIDSLTVSPHTLIDWLTADYDWPVLPRETLRDITLIYIGVTAVATATAVTGPHTPIDVLVALGYPAIAVGASGAFVVVHAIATEIRLWRSNTEADEELYEMLSRADDDGFPRSF